MQLDTQLNDLFYHFDGDIDDLEYCLTDRQFTIVQVNDDDNDEFIILDCDELQLQLENYDLTDPKNLLDDANPFTIAEYQALFSSSVLLESIREKITELLVVPYYLQIFGEVDFK